MAGILPRIPWLSANSRKYSGSQYKLKGNITGVVTGFDVKDATNASGRHLSLSHLRVQ